MLIELCSTFFLPQGIIVASHVQGRHAALTWSRKLPAISSQTRAQRRTATSSNSRSLPFQDTHWSCPNFATLTGKKLLGNRNFLTQRLRLSVITQDVIFRIAPVSLAHQPSMEVDSAAPFLFNYRWSNNKGGVYVGERATTQSRRDTLYGGPAYSTFTPEKRAPPRIVCPGCGMWGSMLDDLTNHSQPKRVFSLRSRWYPSDMIRCLPARLVLMRRNLTCYCASAGY